MPIKHTHTSLSFQWWWAPKLGINSNTKNYVIIIITAINKHSWCASTTFCLMVVVRPYAVLHCDATVMAVCMWAGSGRVLEHNMKSNRIPVTADKCLSVPCALILTVYLICLSLSPSFFQSAALWCTSVAMNSSPSPAPEQIRVLHQMWVQKSLLSPSFLLYFSIPPLFVSPFQSVPVYLSIPLERTEKGGGQKLSSSAKSNQTYCHRGSVWDSCSDDNPLRFRFPPGVVVFAHFVSGPWVIQPFKSTNYPVYSDSYRKRVHTGDQSSFLLVWMRVNVECQLNHIITVTTHTNRRKNEWRCAVTGNGFALWIGVIMKNTFLLRSLLSASSVFHQKKKIP